MDKFIPEHYQPCPESWMNISNERYTICEVLRQIYHETDSPSIKIRARIAMTMAKKMNNKLMEYNAKWQEIFNEKNREMTNLISIEQRKL